MCPIYRRNRRLDQYYANREVSKIVALPLWVSVTDFDTSRYFDKYLLGAFSRKDVRSEYKTNYASEYAIRRKECVSA